ncbi:unnamed protein product [Clavelina lepadiformis]|uniref:G-protein coupled receptors family 1 profile domain-containing protein n=1 Tax=Clavelina lepadiformis TaxID=159417 RepID=A0ABP0GTH5_CLALP
MEQNISLNESLNLTECEKLQPDNPWCGKFGGQQIFEVVYLTIVTVVGTFGNILVICSIVFENRVHKNGNAFIINLAAADLIVTGIYMPTVIANVFETGNALPMIACKVLGYIVTSTCVCSVCNLTFIAVNRYWSIVKRETYAKVFSKKMVALMILFIWFWSNLVVTPTLYGWSDLVYDAKMMECAWDDTASLAYNIILIGCSILVPICVIVVCYWKLFRNVKQRGQWLRKLTVSSVQFDNRDKKKRSLQREVNLLKTLATTVALFVLCWGPYGVCVLGFARTVPYQAKKIFGWMGLSNSAVNFVVYGAMNKVYRSGYKRFLIYLFCCLSCRKHRPRSDSVSIPGFQKTTKRKSAQHESNSFASTGTLPSVRIPMDFTRRKKRNKKRGPRKDSSTPNSTPYSIRASFVIKENVNL